MSAFTAPAKLRFHHMDRAGMVFHGAYVELFQDAFEDLMEHVRFIEKDLEPRLGVRLPVVQHDMRFPAAPEGDRLDVEVTIERIGNSSVVFELVARDASGTVCAEATVVRVSIGPEGRPTPVPDELRKAWAPHVRGP